MIIKKREIKNGRVPLRRERNDDISKKIDNLCAIANNPFFHY